MKSSKVVLVVIILLLNTVLLFAQNEPKVEVTKFSENVSHFRLTTTYSENAVVSMGKDGVLIIDPGMEEISEALETKIKELGDGCVKYIIYSHIHGHHFGATKAIGDKATIIAHKKVREQMGSGANLLQEWPDYTYPDISICKPISIYFNGEEIQIIPMPGSHSDSDIIIHFTKSKVVFIGGLTTNGFPFVDAALGGSADKYPELVGKAIKMFPTDVKFVPAHGNVKTMEELISYHRMLVNTYDIIKSEYIKEKDLEKIQSKNLLKEWESYGAGFVTTNVWTRAIVNSFQEKEISKKSIIDPLFWVLKEKDGTNAVKKYWELKKEKQNEYNFSENDLNLLGYFLIGKRKYKDAIEILKLNVKEYPDSFNVYDSLGEAYMLNGNKKMAVKNYKKSIKLNPENNNGKQKLEELKKM